MTKSDKNSYHTHTPAACQAIIALTESLPNSSFVTVKVLLTVTMATKGWHGCNLKSLPDAFRPTRLSSVEGISWFYCERGFSFFCNYTGSSERSPWNIHLMLSKYPKAYFSYNILCLMSKRLKAFIVMGTASVTNFTGFPFSSRCCDSFILVLFFLVFKIPVSLDYGRKVERMRETQ